MGGLVCKIGDLRPWKMEVRVGQPCLKTLKKSSVKLNSDDSAPVAKTLTFGAVNVRARRYLLNGAGGQYILFR